MKLTPEFIAEMDKELTALWEEYIRAHTQLTQYTNDNLKDGYVTEEHVEPVNEYLNLIQEVYKDLHPLFHWFVHRREFIENAVNSHADYINTLKKNGARENTPQAEA